MDSGVAVHGLNCCMACGVFPDQEPLSHQGSPAVTVTGLDPKGQCPGVKMQPHIPEVCTP